jgi:glycerol-3-phosphate dehydrogenase
MHRPDAFRALATTPFDLLVIGGGITGAGVARDAALRGLRTALVERDDFGSGTSSRSSRLVHGGVRYLEYGQFHLVFEASRERRTLLRIAPHLVRPLRFTWPVYQGARVPGWKLGAGLLLYDALALWRNVARHRRLTAAGVLKREPALESHGLTGGAEYYDAATDDSRLTLANALAASQGGATVLNHTAVTAITRDSAGKASGTRVEDQLTGDAVSVSAAVIVNATGPWSDAVRRLADPGAPPAVSGTKGVHLAVPATRVGNLGAVTLLSAIDGRVMFVLPAGRLSIVGTTDTATAAGPDDVRASSVDIQYLLESANVAFPRARLTASEVVAAWAGIRPLIASGHRADPASASREHEITREPSGVIAVTGGKLTTYRAIAAEVVDAVEGALGRAPMPTRTHLVMLPGADRQAQLDRLVAENPLLGRPLSPELSYRGADLVYGVQSEVACTLADLMMRRTHIAFETRDAGVSLSSHAAKLVAPLLGWNGLAIQAAVDAYADEARRVFGIDWQGR